MARILVSMTDNFLKTIDEVASVEQRTLSELIREALRSYMRKASVKAPKNAVKNANILENLLK